MDATTILQTITLAVSGWALLEIIKMKTKLARLQQKVEDKLDDLPCSDCHHGHKEKLKLSPVSP